MVGLSFSTEQASNRDHDPSGQYDHARKEQRSQLDAKPAELAASVLYARTPWLCGILMPVPPVLPTERIAHLIYGRRLLRCGISRTTPRKAAFARHARYGRYTLTAAATSSRNVPSLRDRNHPGEPPSVGSPTLTVCHSVLAAMNKCLARSNKSEVGGKATKKRTWALMRHDASGSQIDRAPSRAHVARGALRQVSRELP